MIRPWMPWYVADYLADTQHLSTIEHGAYDLLIMHYWRHGGLPADENQLRAITKLTPAQWRKHRTTLSAFFIDWKHGQIDAEIAKAEAKQKLRQEAGKMGGNARANALANATAKQEQTGQQNPSNALASSSESQSEKKGKKEEDTADAVPSSDGQCSKYAFESGSIRLSEKDFKQWESAFSHLDLRAELLSLTEWAGQQQKWFFAVSGALAKRNREVKAKIEAAPKAAIGGFV